MFEYKLSLKTREVLFVICLFLIPLLSPGLSLLFGLLVAFSIGNPFLHHNKVLTKILLQGAVVGLGFGINVGEALEAGKTGFFFTIFSIAVTLGIGLWIGKILKINKDTRLLVSGGTAICGGSAIAAIGSVINANEKDMSVALGTIFTLNAVALLIFPIIGNWLQMNDVQFGYWCALAIHDTSSVVGAAATRSDLALHIATTTKLIRALWIIPISLVVSYFYNKNKAGGKSKVSIPWFIFLFIVAMFISSYIPESGALYHKIVGISHMAMIYTLFLIGTSLSWKTIRSVGFYPVVLGVSIWILISVLSALVILFL